MREAFICDEDQKAVAQIGSFLAEKYADEFCVNSFRGCMDLIGAIQLRERVPDLLITETVLCDGNGIDTVAEIQAEHPYVRVIYMSNDVRSATDIFKTDPSYFLLKPIETPQLENALSKVMAELEGIRREGLVVSSRGSEMIIPCSDIVFIESRARKLCIHMRQGRELDVYDKMDDISQKLGPGFVRCHKSFLANMNYTAAREADQLVLLDGKRLPISKQKARETKEALYRYWK